MATRGLRIASYVGGILFLLGALVQLNDPDPAGWIAMYLSAALSCALLGRFPKSYLLPLLVALIAAAWALKLGLAMSVWVPPTQMFEPMASKGGAVELARELWGLGVMAALQLALAMWAYRVAATKGRA